MKIIPIEASKSYNVYVGTNLYADIVSYLPASNKATKIAIISDSNVFPLYGRTIINSLSGPDKQVVHFIFPAGEASKTAATYISILNFLAESHLTRSDLIIALGGGVVGDLTGFAAATYLRGIDYIQIPTTLLAMVDSSVGGKTAIDLPSGKNLAGAFYQPSAVICDISALCTLPTKIFRDGCAEVIKYAVLYDPDLMKHLQANGLSFNQEYVISRCIELKCNVVSSDEFDRGERQKLNLGHTIGHGVEVASNFSVSHGEAVSIGMAIVSRAAYHENICSKDVCSKILDTLECFNLPTDTDTSPDALYHCALSDKKRSGSHVNLIIPKDIGHCIIQKTPISQLHPFIEAGL